MPGADDLTISEDDLVAALEAVHEGADPALVYAHLVASLTSDEEE